MTAIRAGRTTSVERAVSRHALDPHDATDLLDRMSTQLAGREAPRDEASLPYVATGITLGAAAGWPTYRMHDGLVRARDVITGFESTQTPLDVTNGTIDHAILRNAAFERLCDDVDAAAGFLYPFGSMTVIPLLILWLIAALLVFVDRLRWGCALFAGIAVAVLTVSASFADTFTTAVAILE